MSNAYYAFCMSLFAAFESCHNQHAHIIHTHTHNEDYIPFLTASSEARVGIGQRERPDRPSPVAVSQSRFNAPLVAWRAGCTLPRRRHLGERGAEGGLGGGPALGIVQLYR